MALIIGLYTFLGIVILSLLRQKNRKLNFVGGYSGFTFGMLVYYIFVPIIIIFSEEGFRNNIGYGYDRVIKYIYDMELESFLFLILLVTIGFIGFNIGYNLIFGKSKNLKTNEITNNLNNGYKNKDKFIKFVNIIAYITFFVGGSALIVFFIFVGGIGNALVLAEITRGFENSVTDINYFAGIAKIIARIVTISAILFFYLVLSRNRWNDKVLFAISFIASILLYLSYAGRTPLLTFLIIFFFFFMRKFFKKVWFKIIIIGVISIPLIEVLSQLFLFFQTNIWISNENQYLDYLRQFAPPMTLGLNLREIVDIYGLRYYKDVVTDVIGLLPGIGFPLSYENTSEFFNGINWRNFGGIPNDVISYGYLQFKIAGVFITLLSWGMLMGLLDKTINSMPKDISRDVIAVTLATQVYQIVFAADLAPILLSNNIFLMTVIVLILYRKINKNARITI